MKVLMFSSLVGLLSIVCANCASQTDPPEVSISWLAPVHRAAKAPNCTMPLLSALPNVDYEQLAIVEVAADYDADSLEMAKLAQREACETGADALVVLEDQKQGTTLQPMHIGEHNPDPGVGHAGHSGRFLEELAIAYEDKKTAR